MDDLYTELGVLPTATSRQITKQYRKLALQYHPDKNPGAEARGKFDRISFCYSVLGDGQLRRKYDESRRTPKMDPSVLRFREQLRKAEQDHRWQKVYEETERRERFLQQLQRQATELRQAYHRTKTELPSGHVLYRALPRYGRRRRFGTVSPYPSENAVLVRWKRRPEPEAHISDLALQEIMAIFGPVVHGRVLHEKNLYMYGEVVFEQPEAAAKAVAQDYKSGRLWDKTRFRKAALLLRSCEARDAVPASSDGYTDRVLASMLRDVSTSII